MTQAKDPLFDALSNELHHYEQLLDAYSKSLHFVGKDLHLVTTIVSDRTSEDIHGISGQLNYASSHKRAFDMLLSVLFTPNHRIFITFNKEDPYWQGERARDIKQIRENLVKEFIPRLVNLIKNCRDTQLQVTEL